jgi:hypothetical protein
MKLYIRILFFLCVLWTSASAQSGRKSLIQFSGIVISGDSSQPVPFVNISIKGSSKGTITDFYGFFSLPVEKNDTIELSAIGYKRLRLFMPDTLRKLHYYSVIEMESDTILLRTVVVRPWPPLEQFKQVFLQKKVPDDMMERAKKNLDHAHMKVLFDRMPMDGGMNFRNAVQQRSDRLYYNGQYPPMRILDPLAWAKFVKALQNGELKIKKE